MKITKKTAKQTEQQTNTARQVEEPVKEKKAMKQNPQKLKTKEVNIEVDYFAKGAHVPEITKEQKDNLLTLAKELEIPATPIQTKPHTDEQFRDLRERLLRGKYNS